MHAAGGGEENVGWSDSLSLVAADVFTGARGNKVDLIARVWLLRIDAARRVNLDQQAAVLEDSCEPLAFRTRQSFESFGHGCGDAWVV